MSGTGGKVAAGQSESRNFARKESSGNVLCNKLLRRIGGAVSHGGYRTQKVCFGESQAVLAVGDAKSESSATGKEQREEGQVAHTASAVGEEHASEQDKDSVIAQWILVP